MDWEMQTHNQKAGFMYHQSTHKTTTTTTPSPPPTTTTTKTTRTTTTATTTTTTTLNSIPKNNYINEKQIDKRPRGDEHLK